MSERPLKKRRFRRGALPVRLVVFDFDGVMTDNRVHVFQDGREAVTCNRADGQGCEILRAAGVDVLILSTEINPVVAARAAKLRVEAVQGVADKGAALRSLLSRRGIEPGAVMYVGNDVNDLPAMKIIGWPVVPADAHASVKEIAWYVTRARGGEGVARELADVVVGGGLLTAAARRRGSSSLARRKNG